ncbi:hypothetical protein DFH09DRAFT_1370436 [Mycena vulgaris]|nr:hypothetical protein DFH09DRAFT_1370436 [Mycena vulgaris]
MSYSSTPINPLSVQDRRPSLELSRFSTMFQQWDMASDEGSSSSRRGSQQLDSDYPSGPHTPFANLASDFEASLGAPHARQRTTQACDKCRNRKTKCSGDHPVCKRCTARGLICHYSGRERVRGPAKARLRNAMSSSSLDLRFAGESHGKQEELDPSLAYSFDYSAHPQQPQYQHLTVPTSRNGHGYFESSSQAAPHAFSPPSLSRMSLPHVAHPDSFHPFPVPPHLQQHYVRRVQSYSALGASDAYRVHRMSSFASRPTSSPASQAPSRLGPSSFVEYDMRMPNGGHMQDYLDDGGSSGSEPPSATDSVFSAENISRSSQSSESALPEPLSRSASELDLRLLNHMSQYRHHRLPVLDVHGDEGKAGCHGGAQRFGFHSPAASINSLNDISSPASRHTDIIVPQINGDFGNPWGKEQRVTVREVELMYPSPVTPISLGSDAIEMMARGGFYDYMLDQGAPESIPAEKEEKSGFSGAFDLLNTPLTAETES